MSRDQYIKFSKEYHLFFKRPIFKVSHFYVMIQLLDITTIDVFGLCFIQSGIIIFVLEVLIYKIWNFFCKLFCIQNNMTFSVSQNPYLWWTLTSILDGSIHSINIGHIIDNILPELVALIQSFFAADVAHQHYTVLMLSFYLDVSLLQFYGFCCGAWLVFVTVLMLPSLDIHFPGITPLKILHYHSDQWFEIISGPLPGVNTDW